MGYYSMHDISMLVIEDGRVLAHCFFRKLIVSGFLFHSGEVRYETFAGKTVSQFYGVEAPLVLVRQCSKGRRHKSPEFFRINVAG